MAAWFDRTYDRLEGGWDRASRRKRRWICLGIYTAIFTAAFLLVFSAFLANGTSFIWYVSDGKTQHLPIFVSIGKRLRQLVRNMAAGQFEIPLFDISLGLGDDVIGVYNSMGATNPLVLLSALAPARYAEYLYSFLCVLRMWLMGLSFLYLCRHYHKSFRYALIGSVVYCFGAYGAFITIRHPFFADPMISLPLMIVGTDKILQRDRPYLLILSVYYAALCGYYHLYMMTIMIGIYFVIRCFDLCRKCRIREFFLAAGRELLGYGIGIGLAAVVFFPAVAEFLAGGRADISNAISIDYTWSYFRNRILLMFSPTVGTTAGWSYPAFAAIALFALILLFISKRRPAVKLLTITAFAIYWFSFGQMVMNGFQYPSNRWSFGLVLIVAFVVVEMLPDMLQMSGGQVTVCFAGLLVYAVLALGAKDTRRLNYVTIGVVFVTATLLVLTASAGGDRLAGTNRSGARHERDQRLRTAMCLGLVILNVGVNGIYKTAADQGNLISDYSEWGVISSEMDNSIEGKLTPFLWDRSGRADGSGFTRGWAQMERLPGMLVYSSVANENVTDFIQYTEASGNDEPFNNRSTGQRTISGTLLSQRYHAETAGREAYVPFGYEKVGEAEGDVLIYENRYALPWGYTYDTAMSYEELDALNGVQKQQAMLQAVALEDASVPDGGTALDFDEQIIPYEMAFDGCAYENGVLSVTKKGAAVTLSFAMPAGVEGYVRLSRFDINDSGQSKFVLKVNCGDVARDTTVLSTLNTYYFGREDYLFNLGYSDKERQELTVTFPVKGTFKLGGIELYALPMDNYPAQVEALRAEPLENIQWGTNKLTGTVDLTKDKILCVSVPYSKGWTATVDGEEAEILRGNYMFMCLPLTAGHHEIEFHYCSPGIKLGAAVTGCSAVIVAAMLVCDRRRRKTKNVG